MYMNKEKYDALHSKLKAAGVCQDIHDAVDDILKAANGEVPQKKEIDPAKDFTGSFLLKNVLQALVAFDEETENTTFCHFKSTSDSITAYLYFGWPQRFEAWLKDNGYRIE